MDSSVFLKDVTSFGTFGHQKWIISTSKFQVLWIKVIVESMFCRPLILVLNRERAREEDTEREKKPSMSCSPIQYLGLKQAQAMGEILTLNEIGSFNYCTELSILLRSKGLGHLWDLFQVSSRVRKKNIHGSFYFVIFIIISWKRENPEKCKNYWK